MGESNITLAEMDNVLNRNGRITVLVTEPFKNAMQELAELYHTSASFLFRESALQYLQQAYPEFVELYTKQIHNIWRENTND